MLHLSNLDIGTLIFIVAFIVVEWRYRAKRDGSKHATGAIVFAGIVFMVGAFGQTLFGIGGLVAVLVILMLFTLYAFLKRKNQTQI